MSAVPAASARSSVLTSILIIGVLFFLIGFFTWLNGPLITFVKLAFELDEVGAFLVLMVFYCPTSSWRCRPRGSSSAPA